MSSDSAPRPIPGGRPLTEDDRRAVIAALAVHRQAGRLSSTEYEAREIVASSARTWAEVGVLFGDLPAPHPEPPASASPPPAAPASAGGIDWGQGLVAAMPLIALALFVLTRTWIWFLLIPVVWIFVKGPGRRQ